jgi:aryl-alcohol dehydrogenase-like predicted oxidoreductase
MQRRRLGGLEVSAVGLGCATMTPFYDEPDRDAAIDTLRRAREIGVDFSTARTPTVRAATRN